MAAGWIITKESGPMPAGIPSRVGGIRARGTPEEREEIREALIAGEGVRWRTRDADRNVSYEGRFIMDDSSTGFEPLDFATADVGDVEIQYWQTGPGGGWKTL